MSLSHESDELARVDPTNRHAITLRCPSMEVTVDLSNHTDVEKVALEQARRLLSDHYIGAVELAEEER